MPLFLSSVSLSTVDLRLPQTAYGKYDKLEYAGIWAITIAMTVWGMTAALVTGVIAALSTYAVQVSVTALSYGG